MTISCKSHILDRSWTEINLDHFAYNFSQLKDKCAPHQAIMQIVKADAYGHGAVQITELALKLGAKVLGVANTEEGLLLRFQNIKAPIVILSPSLEAEIDTILEYHLIPSVSDILFIKALNEKARLLNIVYPVHLKCNSGMNRNGVRFEEFLKFYEEVKSLSNIIIEGLFSHFSSSENDETFTLLQYQRFIDTIKPIKEECKYIHISNSSAVVNHQFNETNLVRLGLLSYGVYSDQALMSKIDLKAVMTFKSRISYIGIAKANETIGYNRTYQVKYDTPYAIIPVGYADGYDFLLSGKAHIDYSGIACPVLGKISMDSVVIDISQIENPNIDDEVTLLGGDQSSTHAETLAALYRGSSYELICQIGRRAKRYFIQNETINDQAPILRREFIPKDFSEDKLNHIIHQAIEERIHKKELAEVIYHDILKYFFIDSDRDISYRSGFFHLIEFEDIHDSDKSYTQDYYVVKTSIRFNKVLQNNYFTVACASTQQALEHYFMRRDTEYRWLLDESLDINNDCFNVTSASIDEIALTTEKQLKENCIEFKCHSDLLSSKIGSVVQFEIKTQTLYPRNRHQLSIYISEITKGVHLRFMYPDSIKNVEVVPIFSGRNKYPQIKMKQNTINIFTHNEEWVFPNSGVVFSY